MKNFFLITLFSLIFGSYLANAQITNFDTGRNSNQASLSSVFDNIQSGISAANVSRYSSYISEKSYFSLFNGVNGYFSVNQSLNLLKDFFNIYKPVSFKFDPLQGGKNPFATGTLVYENKGKRETALVFISLTADGNGWYISQFSIK